MSPRGQEGWPPLTLCPGLPVRPGTEPIPVGHRPSPSPAPGAWPTSEKLPAARGTCRGPAPHESAWPRVLPTAAGLTAPTRLPLAGDAGVLAIQDCGAGMGVGEPSWVQGHEVMDARLRGAGGSPPSIAPNPLPPRRGSGALQRKAPPGVSCPLSSHGPPQIQSWLLCGRLLPPHIRRCSPHRPRTSYRFNARGRAQARRHGHQVLQTQILDAGDPCTLPAVQKDPPSSGRPKPGSSRKLSRILR